MIHPENKQRATPAIKVAIDDVRCASLPREALGALARLRCQPGVRLALVGERAWVQWEAGDEQVLLGLLSLTGAHLYLRRRDHWHRVGHHLPAFEVPLDLATKPLLQLLAPCHFEPIPASEPRLEQVPLIIVADARPRRTMAMRCGLAALARWADSVPSTRLADYLAARCADEVLLLGDRLPLLPEGERFWGTDVLVPLGYRPEPALTETALRDALNIGDGELVLLEHNRTEVIAREVFQPLSRAGVRLAMEERPR